MKVVIKPRKGLWVFKTKGGRLVKHPGHCQPPALPSGCSAGVPKATSQHRRVMPADPLGGSPGTAPHTERDWSCDNRGLALPGMLVSTLHASMLRAHPSFQGWHYSDFSPTAVFLGSWPASGAPKPPTLTAAAGMEAPYKELSPHGWLINPVEPARPVGPTGEVEEFLDGSAARCWVPCPRHREDLCRAGCARCTDTGTVVEACHGDVLLVSLGVAGV